jgi:lipoprotein-releasing system ATP-binding protein
VTENLEILPQPAPSTAQPETVLACRGLRKAFEMGGRRLEILQGVDLDVHRGELVSLVGASGTGKSTLLHVLGLLDRPNEGSVRIQGEDAWSLSARERAALRNTRIGFVFQFYHLISELDAVENVLLPAMIAHSTLGFRAKRRELYERAEDLLIRFGLQERLHHRPSKLSGGERQRVAIARALFHDPPLILADEPTGNLDRATGERVLELLLEEQRRRRLTMLLVTHDTELAARCGRGLVLRDGRVHDAED